MLPSLQYSSIQTVTIEMVEDKESEIFSYSKARNEVTLNKETREEFFKGARCPEGDLTSIKFLLNSDILGEAMQSIDVTVEG